MLQSFLKSKIILCIVLLFSAGVANKALGQMTFGSIPTGNATNIGVNSNIELDFDTDIDLISVHNNSTNPNEVYDDHIKIVGSQSGQLEGTYSNGADISIVVKCKIVFGKQ